MNDECEKRFRWRTLTSLVMVLLFSALLVSGLVLYLAPEHGAGRRWWSLWGLGTLEWGSWHGTLSILFMLASAVHLAFNARVLARCARRTRELAVGVGLAALLIVGALLDWPPLNLLSGAQEELRAGADSHRCAHGGCGRGVRGDRGWRGDAERGGRGWCGGRRGARFFP